MTPRQPRFVNRELSWLEFDQRVLDEARDPAVPVLERLKFLAITASNLDEFFMVRVGGLELQAQRRSPEPDPAGLTPLQQLIAIRDRVERMVRDQIECLVGEIEPAMAAAGIRRLLVADLTPAQGAYLERLFESEFLPQLTPMAVQSPDRFPLLANLMLYVAARLAPAAGAKHPRFALIPLGSAQERVVTLPVAAGYAFALLEDVVRAYADRFFPGVKVLEAAPVRIARNASLAVREEFTDDFLGQMKAVLDERRDSDCVRLQVQRGISDALLAFLMKGLGIERRQVYEVNGPLGLGSFMRIAEMDGFPALRYPPWPAQPSARLHAKRGLFQELTRRPVLLYHPYESFEPVVRFVEEAADDPDVLAIKQILYRTSSKSPIVAALRRAAERGKYVTALVELKARFDEARNIEWAEELEKSGVQVIYGVRGLKTHAKLCIVVRREPQGVVRYLHFGTGNYNERTARLYGDVSYMTKDEDLGADAAAFFNAICGYSEPQNYLKIAAAPFGLRDRLLDLIRDEAHRRRDGQKALIMAKMNSLVDPQIIEALYEASRAGVEVRLNVRGICCLRPGVRGLSENISVVSIVDRYLEHARLFYFHHGGERKVFLSSADWMPRNLDRRVELLVPVEDATSQRELIAILETHFHDNVKARVLLPDGGYAPPHPAGRRFRSQEALHLRARDAIRRVRRGGTTVFESHRPSRSRSDRE
jgi:polyphosphate kinase